MSAVNKTIRFFAYLGVCLLNVISGYLVSLVYTAPILCITMTILSIFNKNLALLIANNFWKIYLIACIPIAIAWFISTEFKVNKALKNRK